MSAVVIIFVFLIALGVSLLYGAGYTYALVYLPAMILLNQLPELNIPHAPVAAQFGPIYAILIAWPFRTEKWRLKWCMMDTIIVLLLASAMITAWSTEFFETGVNTFRTEILQWIGPYFLARLLFRSVEVRRMALYVLIALVAILTFAAAIEFRLQPYWYLRLLQSLGMSNKLPVMAYTRAGFFRVAGTVEHPIYFGNMCVVLLGMIAVLARTSGVSLKNPLVLFGMAGSVLCVIMSISFTPYMGLAAGGIFFLTLVAMPWTRPLVLPITLGVIGIIFAYTYHAAHTPLGEKPEDDSGINGSLYTRQVIIFESWKKAMHAGPFGWGRDLRADSTDEDFDLSSVDNSYMQFTMTRGWVYTTLWISIAVFFSLRMTLAFMKVTHRSQIFPLAVATATVLGLMVSMYTVWAGALYKVVWAVMLGLCTTLADLIFYPELVNETKPTGKQVVVRRRGFDPARPTPAARNPYWQINDV